MPIGKMHPLVTPLRLTTGKNEKVHSLHVRGSWFISFQLYFKNSDFSEYEKFGAIW